MVTLICVVWIMLAVLGVYLFYLVNNMPGGIEMIYLYILGGILLGGFLLTVAISIDNGTNFGQFSLALGLIWMGLLALYSHYLRCTADERSFFDLPELSMSDWQGVAGFAVQIISFISAVIGIISFLVGR